MNHISRETFDRLMQGQDIASLPEAALHLKKCPDCRREVDLLLLGQEWLTAGEAGNKNAGSVLTDGEWQSVFDSAWEKSSGAAKVIRGGNRFHRALYALAACVILAVGAYITLKPIPVVEQKVAATVVVPEKIFKRGNPSRRVSISQNTSAMASTGSDVRLVRNSGTEVTAELSSGSALFSVEPGRYKAFHVNTPDAEVTVTGTIFDVWVTGQKTCVSVLRGSVKVLYKKLKANITLAKEETASPDSARVSVRPMTFEEKAEITAYLEKITSSAIEEKQTPLDAKLTVGLRSLNKGDYNDALAVFGEIKASGLKTSAVQTACFESGVLLINKMNRATEGIAVLEDYLKQFVKGLYTEEALSELVSTARKQGNPDKVIQFEEKYVSLFPEKKDSREFIYETATLLREEKREYGESARHYSMFLEKCPGDFRAEDAFFWLGKCYLMTGNNPKAREIYNQYLGKFPDGRWVSDIKALLQK